MGQLQNTHAAFLHTDEQSSRHEVQTQSPRTVERSHADSIQAFQREIQPHNSVLIMIRHINALVIFIYDHVTRIPELPVAVLHSSTLRHYVYSVIATTSAAVTDDKLTGRQLRRMVSAVDVVRQFYFSQKLAALAVDFHEHVIIPACKKQGEILGDGKTVWLVRNIRQLANFRDHRKSQPVHTAVTMVGYEERSELFAGSHVVPAVFVKFIDINET